MADELTRLNNQYQLGTRAVGAGQMVLGGVGVVASGAAAPACTTGVGCVAVAGGALLSADQAVTGARQMVSGRPETTGVSHTLQSLGLSAEAAGMVEMAAGVGSAAGASRALMNASSPARVGGIADNTSDVLELGGGPGGSKIPGARNIDPRDPNAIGSDMRNMPNVADNSQRQVVVSNPYLQGVEPSARNMNAYLPEAARVTQPGGEIIISGNNRNPFFTNMPTAAELDALGLEIKYQGPLLPSLSNQTFAATSGGRIRPEDMQTIIFIKKKK